VGCLIVPFIFVIRRTLAETEAFKARTHRPNAKEAIKSIIDNWQIVLAGMLMVVMTTVSFYLITVYTPTYGKNILKLEEIDGAHRDILRRRLELVLVTCDGSGLRPAWSPAHPADVHGPCHRDRISGVVLAGCAAELRQDAHG